MRRLTGGSSAAAAVVVLCGILAASRDSFASLQDTGRWETSAIELGAQATHMCMLRGDGDSTKIAYWHSGQVDARMWDPSDASSARRFPSPNPIFCAGHSMLSDGRLLVTGGTEGNVGSIGLRPSTLFNPRRSQWAGQGPWRSGPSATHGRWYPTNVTLGNGKVWTFSGNKYSQLIAYGGHDGTSTLSAVKPLTMTTTPAWKSEVSGMPARTNHSAIQWHDKQRTIVFGGRSGTTLYDEIWELQYLRYDDQSEDLWSAQKLSPGYDPALGSTLGYPSARENHGAIVDPATAAMFIYGGRNASGTALSDLWMLDLDAISLQWKRVSDAADPGARYGHSCVYDRGATDAGRQMLVFGGATSSTQLATTSVWALSLEGSTYSWSTPTLQVGSPVPDARYGHAASFDGITRPHGQPAKNARRMLLVGGRQDESSVIESDAIWNLWIPQDGSAPYWQSVIPATPRPERRANAALAFDGASGQFVLTGGERPSTIYGNTWALRRLSPCDGSALCDIDPYWIEVATSSGPRPRKGATAVVDATGVFARIPEEFSSSGSGSWTELATGFPKWQLLYPFMHLLPSGYLFESGPTNPQLLNPQSGWIATEYDAGFIGGSSVMYAPNKVMKCGGPLSASSKLAIPVTKYIEFNGSPPSGGWQSAAIMTFARQDHNLTMLPDGRVLATGGVGTNGDINTAVKVPEIWDPASHLWENDFELPEDPSARGYHAVAILLPDARVMTAGGDGVGAYQLKGTIYSPGYLFSGEDLAVRPAITRAPSVMGYGHQRMVCVDNVGAIGSVCLIRPGAVTHSFDQSQRFVPLSFSTCSSGLLVTTPADENAAPPGDYLLFVLNTAGVPSVAKWVRVQSDATTEGCDNTAPAAAGSFTADPQTGRYSVKLTWTGPGDDGTSGTPVEFDLRQSTAAITESNFGLANRITANVPIPGSGQTQYCMEVDYLAPCQTHYFRLKAMDDGCNWSPLSAVASATTTCSGYTAVLCDGGGLLGGGGGEGGEGAQAMRLASTGSGSIVSAEEASGDNSLLWAGDGAFVADLHHLGSSARERGGSYGVRLQQAGSWRSAIDRLSVGIVDHDPGVEAFAESDSVLLGTVEPVSGVTDATGAAVTLGRGQESGESLVGRAGDQFLVQLNGGPSSALVLESKAPAPRPGTSSGGILVQSPSPEGGWVTLSEVQPRRKFARRAVRTDGSSLLRLVFLRDCELRSLSQLTVMDAVSPQPLELAGANHSSQGEVGDALSQTDGSTSSLMPGDTLGLSFHLPPRNSIQTRDVFLTVRGALEPATTTGSAEIARESSTPEVAWAFALGGARPNPSFGTVLIDYTLAHKTRVNLRVYDALGRLVRTVVNEERPAGPQSVSWDGRTDRGQAVAAGIYFYRMDTTGWHSERKLIVLQK